MNKSNTYRPGGDPKADIDILRQVIDEIDEKILDLINQRLSLAKQIGDFKKKGGIQITDKEILNRLLKKNSGPTGADGLRNIFNAIIAEGRKIQGLG
jgi:chorismate mutase